MTALRHTTTKAELFFYVSAQLVFGDVPFLFFGLLSNLF
jgi:hypothetical protein